ncbi:hypothetical protein [uncultured Marinobacter sp.]|uniref:hypothetical protein n=1 Tax=uncultured Marinobacter sp. TaxID=187379 RepID=UPI002594CDB0|nr:hypothetical protein [uncultured Marinobacter sp.]
MDGTQLLQHPVVLSYLFNQSFLNGFPAIGFGDIQPRRPQIIALIIVNRNLPRLRVDLDLGDLAYQRCQFRTPEANLISIR